MASARGGSAKDGGVPPERLEGIKQALLADAQKQDMDLGTVRTSDLAKLAGDIQQFMEDEFGVRARREGKEWLMTRLPARVFRDASPKGALFTIFKTAYNHKEIMQWRSFNFEAKGGKREENIALLLSIQQALREAGQLRLPRLRFEGAVPESVRQALQRIAEAHAATVVGKDEEGGSSSKDAPTHIVHWDPEGMDKGLPRALLRSGGADAGGDASSDDEADAHPGDVGGNGSSSRPRKPCRIVEKDGGRGLVRVHWVGYPESYDEWRGAGEAPAGAAEDLDAGKGGPPFHVCCRFVADVDRFNEWGREGDYLPTAMAGPSSSAGGAAASSATTPRGGGGSGASHRKAQPSSAASSVASVPVLDRIPKKAGASSSKNKVKEEHGASTESPARGHKRSRSEAEESVASAASSSHKKAAAATTAASAAAPAAAASASSQSKKKKRKEASGDAAAAAAGAEGNGGGGGEGQEEEGAGGPSPTKKSKKKKKKEEKAEAPAPAPAPAAASTHQEQAPSQGLTKHQRRKAAQAEAELRRQKQRREGAVEELAGGSLMEVDEANERATGTGPGVPPPSEAPFAQGYAAMLEIRTKELSWIGAEVDEEEDDGEGEGGQQRRKLRSASLGHLRAAASAGEEEEEEDVNAVPVVDEGAYPPKAERAAVPPVAHAARPLPHLPSRYGRAWFDPTAVHPIERRYLPEFFSGRGGAHKTPEVYLAYRGFMVEASARSPKEYLTYTDCRRRLAGDAGAILRVHEFLDRWGLINAEVPDELRPAAGNAALLRLAHPLPLAPPPPPASAAAAAPVDGDWSAGEVEALMAAAVELKDDWDGVAARVSSSAAAAASSGTSKPRTAAECLAKFLSLPLEREAGGKGGNAGAAGASEWVRRLAAGVDGQVVKTVVASAWEEVQRRREQAQQQQPPPPSDDVAAALAATEAEAGAVAAASVLSLVGLQARALAEAEEKEAAALMGDLLELKLRRLEGRVKQLDELERLLEGERMALQREREDAFLLRAQTLVQSYNSSS